MRIFKYVLYLMPTMIFIIVVIARELQREELGSKTHPIKVLITPSIDANQIISVAREMENFLHQETGYYFTTAVPASYVAVVEAFGSRKADIAIINTFSYLMANEKYGATASLRLVRENEQKTYKGEILVKADSPIKSLQDLNNKKIAFVDPASFSGYVLPKAMLDSAGVTPSEIVFAMKHDNVVTMVYQGQVDAGAAYYLLPEKETGKILDARAKVMPQFPDVMEKIRILTFTKDVPNDPVIFSKEMNSEMRERIVQAYLKFTSTPRGSAVMYQISGIKKFMRTSDEDYNGVRQMLKELRAKEGSLGKK